MSDAVTNIDYNALNKITRKEYGNGAVTDLTYKTDDFRLQRIWTDGLQFLEFSYDEVGNVVMILDGFETKSFEYDDLDRLTRAWQPSVFDLTYAYDSIGNLLGITGSETVI